MKPELTEAEWLERLAYFTEEKEIGQRHVDFALGQIAVAHEHLSGQLVLDFTATTESPPTPICSQ